nr:ATP synthase subunit 8 [Spartocera fusca]
MPQMSPLWWEMLFSLFTTTLLLMNMIMYFNSTPMSNYTSKYKMSTNQIKWKW